LDLAGKVAIVTGSGGNGSGRAIACRLARDGAAVVVSDIDVPSGHETVRQIESDGGRAAFCQADVRVEDQVRDLVSFAETTFGGLAVLVNNASAVHSGEPLENWSDTIQTELMGTLYATRFAIDAMRRGGGGSIVNMSSISALWHGRAKPGVSIVYDAAKAGVLRITTGLAWLAEKDHIRVNCFAPGWIATAGVRSYWETLTPEQRRERGAPARLLELEEVADAVVRLATDESLAGRILVWWSDDAPGLIPWCDPGHGALIGYPDRKE
jgi:NAD(P)-dependent dehydrogenase (short-subunit alcohol dehydrogenase family)